MVTTSPASIATSAMAPSTQDGSGNQPVADAEQSNSTIASLVSASPVVAETSKTSMMSMVGPNFLIPKNKALVPVTRTTTKWEPLEPKKEEVKRKTKWGPDLTEEPAVKRGRALAYQTRAEQLAAQLESNNLEIDYNESTRSPSPPPVYDALGHRMNTREGRKRDRLDVERREAIGECMKLNPFYKPPAGYRPVLKEAKCFIPAKEHPGYNFIGLILGPRGNTQKRLETETGCRITIRGKGSIKDGKTLPYRHGKDNDGTSEELHVHIAAETYEKVDAAVAIVEPLLIPVDEDRNIYKMKQLRELAEMNGTVFDLRRICTLCGEEGHREWQCPKDKLQTFQAKVICRLCGDGSHPTMDCPLKLTGQGKTIDKEYLSFLEELGVGLGGIDPQVKSDMDNNTNGTAADTSLPMLLTATGPMPAKWMDGFNEFNRRMAAGGGGEPGGFPRLPFPFPFPPPGPQAMRFLAPLFNPAFVELFKGRPPPPPLQMMAFMLSAFRGRFPFPPFGFRPDMMRPPMPPPSSTAEVPSSSMPMDVSAPGQTENMDAEGAAQINSEGLPFSTGTLNEFEQQHSVVASSAPTSAEVPMFPNSFSLESKPKSPSLPAFSPIPPNIGEFPPSGLPVSPVAPPPMLPSVRPVPSIRPVIPPVLQPPIFTPVGGPGFAPPSVVGASSSTNLSSLETQPLPPPPPPPPPPQTWNGWSQGQSSSMSQSEKPASEFSSSSSFSSPGISLPPFQPKIDRPYFSVGDSEIHPYPSGLHTSSFTSLHPAPSFPSPHPPMPLKCYTPMSAPFGAPPSFVSNPLPPLPDQFEVAGDSRRNNYPPSYPDSLFGPPSPLGPQSRSGGSMNAAPPFEDYGLFTPLSQRSTSGLARPASPVSHPAFAYQHASSFSASDFPYPRVQEPLSATSSDLHMHANYKNADAFYPGIRSQFISSLDKDFRGTTSEPFQRNYKYEPSIPPHILQQNIKSPWSSDLLSRARPEFPQAWVHRGAGGSWVHPSAENAAFLRPSTQETDPEYEKLMSSVGVL